MTKIPSKSLITDPVLNARWADEVLIAFDLRSSDPCRDRDRAPDWVGVSQDLRHDGGIVGQWLPSASLPSAKTPVWNLPPFPVCRKQCTHMVGKVAAQQPVGDKHRADRVVGKVSPSAYRGKFVILIGLTS